MIGIVKIAYTIISDDETFSTKPFKEYNNLFTKKEQNKLIVLATTTSKNRYGVSDYRYNNDFNLLVYKVKLATNKDLKYLIKIQNESSYQSLNAVYSKLPSFNFDFKIKAGKSVFVSIVNFKFTGDSVYTIENNNISYYYFKFKTFSINYNDEPYDIVANADDSLIPVELLFKKINNYLYLFCLSAANEKGEMKSDLLYNMINK